MLHLRTTCFGLVDLQACTSFRMRSAMPGGLSELEMEELGKGRLVLLNSFWLFAEG